MPISLQDIMNDQQGMTPDQIATRAQGLTLPSLGSNTPAQDLSTARGGTSNYSTAPGNNNMGTDQSVQFGLALQGLLKNAQTLGTKPFVTQALNASDAQSQAIMAPTQQSLIGASPSVQDSVRNNQASVFSPLISGANNSAQTFSEQLGGFKDAVSSAQNFMQAYQAQQEQVKQNAQNIVHDAIAGGSDALTALIKSQPDLIKLAGYTPDTLQGVVSGLQKQESSKGTQIVEVNGHSLLIDSKGNTIKDLGQSNSYLQSIISHNSGGGLGTSTVPQNIVDPATDAKVKSIIASRPGDGGWGDTAAAINKAFNNPNAATVYDSWLKAVFQNGQSVSSLGSPVPSNVAPYLQTSNSGVQYVDASTLQGTASQKNAIVNAAQKAGLKVITNKNAAADLANISDANNKLDTIAQVYSSISQPNWLSRDLGGAGLTSASSFLQTNAQKTAASTLNSIGLDMLKALSGVQGFRGNQTAIQQINDHLPKITDTQDVVNTKIAYLRQLMSDREDGLLGTKNTSGLNQSSTNSNQITQQDGTVWQQNSDGSFTRIK